MKPVLRANQAGPEMDILGWEASRLAAMARSERRAWRVAGAACLLASLAVTAVVVMLPLKSSTPYLIEVERATGAATAVPLLESMPVTANAVVNKYWLARYVRARESYDWYTLQHDYELTRLLSSPDVAQAYDALFEGPEALDQRYGESTQVQVKVLSLVDHGNGAATVRFSRGVHDRTVKADSPATEIWVASIGFAYGRPQVLSEAQRLENPLAFQVLSYRKDIELGE